MIGFILAPLQEGVTIKPVSTHTKTSFSSRLKLKKKLVGGATTRAVFWRKAGEFGDSEPKMQVFVIDDCVLKLCKSI